MVCCVATCCWVWVSAAIFEIGFCSEFGSALVNRLDAVGEREDEGRGDGPPSGVLW